MTIGIEVAHAAIACLLGNLARAMGLRAAEFFYGPIEPRRRVRSFAGAFFLILLTALFVDTLGLVLMALAWSGSLVVPLLRRKALGQGRHS